MPGIRTVRSIKKAYDNDFETVPVPLALHFEATYACTCKCVFCNRWIEGSKRIQDELTYGEVLGLVDDAYDLGVRSIFLSGGEPLIKKGILDAMRYARKKGMSTSITDNGTLISEGNVQEVLDSFDVISISLDSLIKEKHDEIRGVDGTFDKAMKSIRLLKANSKNTTVSVQSVLTAENMNDLIEINQRFARIGVHTMFQPIHDELDSGYEVRQMKFKNFDHEKLRQKYLEILERYAYPSFIDRKLTLKKYYGRMMDFIVDPESTMDCFNCFAGSFSFFVNPYGEVYPCDPLRTSMGNIREKSLKKIWYGEESSELRRRIKNRKCNCWLLCSAPVFINLTRYIK